VVRYRAPVAGDVTALHPRKLSLQQSSVGLEENPCSQPEQFSLGQRASRGASYSKASLPRCSSSTATADCRDNASAPSPAASWQRPMRLLRNDSRSRAMPQESARPRRPDSILRLADSRCFFDHPKSENVQMFSFNAVAPLRFLITLRMPNIQRLCVNDSDVVAFFSLEILQISQRLRCGAQIVSGKGIHQSLHD
jgi:hypothetical protein